MEWTYRETRRREERECRQQRNQVGDEDVIRASTCAERKDGSSTKGTSRQRRYDPFRGRAEDRVASPSASIWNLRYSLSDSSSQSENSVYSQKIDTQRYSLRANTCAKRDKGVVNNDTSQRRKVRENTCVERNSGVINKRNESTTEGRSDPCGSKGSSGQLSASVWNLEYSMSGSGL